MFLGGSCVAQQKAFDQAYDKIGNETAQKDLQSAIHAAEQLYRSVTLPVHRMKSLMLIARLYQQKEELETSVSYARKLENLAGQYHDYTWQARANGYLAGLYRMMELYEKSKMYSGKALQIIPRIKDPEEANSTMGLMLQELAFTNKEEENYRQAILHLKRADTHFSSLKSGKERYVLNNERFMGDNYRLMAQYDTALIHYQTALGLSKNFPVNYTTGLIYKGISEAQLKKGNLPEAKRALDKAATIADESQYLQLKSAVYSLSNEYYARVRDREKLALSREKTNTVTDSILDKRAHLLDRMLVEADREKDGMRAFSTGRNILFGAVTLCLILITSVILISRRKQKRELEMVRHALDFLHGKEVSQQSGSSVEPVVSKTADKRIMPEETEHLLLARLTEFERSTLFLEAGFSLASLAKWSDTNTKYLSYVIGKHKESDFNTYVNRLRIQFVIRMLEGDPRWRHYKISVLAQESGFSSHSQFSAVFKTCTGLSPSSFLKHLSKGTE